MKVPDSQNNETTGRLLNMQKMISKDSFKQNLPCSIFVSGNLVAHKEYTECPLYVRLQHRVQR